tara:strand:- start:579 stop:1061 length:483 start_codon:yes stop_codon:yes gene_type:complete
MCELIFFSSEHGSIVLILAEVLTEIGSYIQTDQSFEEAGGLLIGERRGGHFIVNGISSPQPTDVRRRSSFVRNVPGHYRIVQSAFRMSGGTSNYLGEWHTHPEDIPRPSSVDKESWVKNSLELKKHTLALIQGRKGIYFSLILADGRVLELKQVTDRHPK